MSVQSNQRQSILMDGKALSAEIKEQLKTRVDAIVQGGARKPGLAVVLVGDDKASALYVKNKVNSCKKVGIESFMFKFSGDIQQEELLELSKAAGEPLDASVPKENCGLAIDEHNAVDHF